MDIYSLHVGQGQFVVVRGDSEAIIVDTFVPLNPQVEIVYVKGALTEILSRRPRKLVGLMITGFDADHFNEVGLQIVLNKYRPKWIMYPRYYKQTTNATRCFQCIRGFEAVTSFQTISACVSDNGGAVYRDLCRDFLLEVFSPHVDDITSSNSGSLVCRIEERRTGVSYLVTGDTEGERWDSIVDDFGDYLKSDVLAAPHHGSRNGITEEAMRCIEPHTVIISAGVDNRYGHPDDEALELFESFECEVFSTNGSGGQSLRTCATSSEHIQTKAFYV